MMISVLWTHKEEHKSHPVTLDSSIEVDLNSLTMDVATQHLKEKFSDVSFSSSMADKTAGDVC